MHMQSRKLSGSPAKNLLEKDSKIHIKSYS